MVACTVLTALLRRQCKMQAPGSKPAGRWLAPSFLLALMTWALFAQRWPSFLSTSGGRQSHEGESLFFLGESETCLSEPPMLAEASIQIRIPGLSDAPKASWKRAVRAQNCKYKGNHAVMAASAGLLDRVAGVCAVLWGPAGAWRPDVDSSGWRRRGRTLVCRRRLGRGACHSHHLPGDSGTGARQHHWTESAENSSELLSAAYGFSAAEMTLSRRAAGAGWADGLSSL